MVMSWLDERRRRRILEQPFPEPWLAALRRNLPQFSWLDDAEQLELVQIVQVFIADKHWEGVGGLELTDEIRVTIAAHACLLVLRLPHDVYRQVDTILVYPSTVWAPSPRASAFAVHGSGVVDDAPKAILGQAFSRGPVILVWDAVQAGVLDPRDGRNVVLHEFAHKLDMLAGTPDGVPPLTSDDTWTRWVEVFTREYEALQRARDQGRRLWLDDYALTNGAEFFAVATEEFFEQPLEMESDHAAMYGLMRDFFGQDPAERLRRARSSGLASATPKSRRSKRRS
jgi:MtfA peptidase